MMEEVSRFYLMETPETLMGIMNNAIVQTWGLKTKTYGRAQALKFVEVQGVHKGYKDNEAIPILRLKDADNDDMSFNSYICDYKDGQINYQVLDKEANFCFTWTMNGCTFGIGSKSPNGTVMVSHGNAKGQVPKGSQQETLSAQHAKQKEWAEAMHGDTVTMLQPASYRPTGSKQVATTFGLKTADGWKFYYQSYDIPGGGRIDLKGVHPIVGKNSHTY